MPRLYSKKRAAMELGDFDYNLPKELIAQQPLDQRDASRLMVLRRQEQTVEHRSFSDLPAYLHPGDVLVANDTRVIPARLYGRKETGGWVELFLLKALPDEPDGGHIWECLIKSKRRVETGMRVIFDEALSARMLERTGDEAWRVSLACTGDLHGALERIGITPLPPYIRRQRGIESRGDRQRYQTVYAARDGAVAAPTAGFHFTPELIEKLRRARIETVFVTLHVGYGTFQPIRENIVERHTMHTEAFAVSPETAAAVNRARAEKRRVIAVGTTSTRVLESMTDEQGMLKSGEGETGIFIYPGYRFKALDGLITNFHVPKSSLLLLVSAFAGRDFILRAYADAVEQCYRFFSYGDAMLIL
jgi:S-adenosylmethionine:tRNA ribosyltransferase-isomerase